MKKQTQSHVFDEKEFVGIKCTISNNGQNENEFIVPILDTRRSMSDKENIKIQLKQANKIKGSKFLKPSYSVIGHSYQESYKK